MATLPGGVLDFTYEMFMGGQWADVTTDVHAAGDTVHITSSRANESSDPDPTRCEFVLDNSADKYSIDNPVGPYFGQLGRNTPIRKARNLGRDTFTRVVVNGWSSADTGQVYSLTGVGGSLVLSDWQVNGSVGTQSVPVANGFRIAYLATEVHRDIDILRTVSLGFTDVTGGDVDFGILLRGQTTSDYLHVRLTVTTAEAIQLTLRHPDGTVFAGPLTIAGLTHTSAQALKFRAQVEGQTVRAKVWAATGSEPYGWQLAAHVEKILVAGWVGFRDGIAAGNTNTMPIVFTTDNAVIRSLRCSVELSSIKQRWGESDKDRYAVVEASGILWRLGHGNSPLQSTLYRGVTTLATPAVAYWPAEDSEGSTSVASAVSGVGPMYVSGPTKFAQYADIPSSKALPTVGAAAWVGSIPAYTSTGKVQLRFIAHIPASAVVDKGILADIHTSASSINLKWEVKYRTGGALSLEMWSGTKILDSGPIAFGIDDKNVMISLELQQNGANIDWNLAVLEVGQTLGFVQNGTVAGRTLNSAVRVTVSPYSEVGNGVIGHINVRKEVTNLFDLNTELRAFDGEAALTRIIRLCAQNSIPLSYISDPIIDSAVMGPQRPLRLLELLKECADADLGSLAEPRGELGISYRERASLYNQPATVTLDYAAEHISPPFVPEADDQLVHNDVTASRVNGSSSRAEVKTGPMSVLDPSQGGIGRYDHQVTVNVQSDGQLPDTATWLAHLGTITATRYPRIRVDLAVLPTAIVSALLDLSADDRFVITNPRSGQTSDAISLLARGFAEEQTPFSHYLTLNATPETPYRILTYDGAESRYDTDGSDLTSAINSSVNSFQVDVPLGPLWTVDPADMPILFLIGGEVMSVGAIAGASSPQTFSSVTRSVNGVVKGHVAGEAVELADPAVVGL